MPLGFDETPGQNRKHYRKFYNDRLEDHKEIMPASPFDIYDIKGGNTSDGAEGGGLLSFLMSL